MRLYSTVLYVLFNCIYICNHLLQRKKEKEKERYVLPHYRNSTIGLKLHEIYIPKVFDFAAVDKEEEEEDDDGFRKVSSFIVRPHLFQCISTHEHVFFSASVDRFRFDSIRSVYVDYTYV